MMATFSELRDAIIATLGDALQGVRLYAKVVDRANLPAILVEPANATFPFTMGRAEDEWQFNLIVVVPYTEASLAQEQLDVFLSGSGAKSIRQIIMQSRNLGRSDVLAAYVAGMSDYGPFTIAGVDGLGCRLQVIVATTGPTWA